MALNMRENTLMIYPKVREGSYCIMAMYIQESGNKDYTMEMVNLYFIMVQHMMEDGKMVLSKDRE